MSKLMECPVCGKLHVPEFSKPGGTRSEKRRAKICVCSAKCQRIFSNIAALAVKQNMALTTPLAYDALIATYFKRRIRNARKQNDG